MVDTFPLHVVLTITPQMNIHSFHLFVCKTVNSLSLFPFISDHNLKYYHFSRWQKCMLFSPGLHALNNIRNKLQKSLAQKSQKSVIKIQWSEGSDISGGIKVNSVRKASKLDPLKYRMFHSNLSHFIRS